MIDRDCLYKVLYNKRQAALKTVSAVTSQLTGRGIAYTYNEDIEFCDWDVRLGTIMTEATVKYAVVLTVSDIPITISVLRDLGYLYTGTNNLGDVYKKSLNNDNDYGIALSESNSTLLFLFNINISFMEIHEMVIMERFRDLISSLSGGAI